MNNDVKTYESSNGPPVYMTADFYCRPSSDSDSLYDENEVKNLMRVATN
jgi:hypothetical protein